MKDFGSFRTYFKAPKIFWQNVHLAPKIAEVVLHYTDVSQFHLIIMFIDHHTGKLKMKLSWNSQSRLTMTMVSCDICSKCLHEDPSQFELVTFKCFNSDHHRGEQKMEVCWNPQSRELEPMLYPPQRSRDQDSSKQQSQIRPMPTISISGRFVLCDPRRGKCRGDKCTFAHSIEERDAWNAQRDREIRKPVLIQVPTPVGST